MVVLGMALLLMWTPMVMAQPEPPENPSAIDFISLITNEGLYTDLAVLAADDMEGRDTGSEGLRKAAAYLSKRYTEIGVEPVGTSNTYNQYFTLDKTATHGHAFTLFKRGRLVDTSVLDKDHLASFISLFNGSNPASGTIVFAGLGMFNEEEGINQYGSDLDGKWIMIFQENGASNVRQLQQLVGSSGAVGAILIRDTENDDTFNESAAAYQSRLGSGGSLTLSYLTNDVGGSTAYVVVNASTAASILDVDGYEGLTRYKSELLDNPSLFTPRTLDVSLTYTPQIRKERIKTSNIAGLIRGTDPFLKNEIVVLSSHYDHVGIGAPDSTGDTIYNGADDDGSGTVGILHTANALIAAKRAGFELKRSVLILHVSGEEKGLLGSRYYSDHPLYSIENTIANLNVDMIGRIDPEYQGEEDYIYIIGGSMISSGLDSLIQAANTASVNLDLNMKFNDLNDPNQFYRRSDHWNFGRLGVPFAFFFNGTHEDYHRPSDHIEKIDFDALRIRTQLLYTTTLMLANTDERPLVDNQEFIRRTQARPRN